MDNFLFVLNLIVYFIGLAVIVLTLLPLFRYGAWWVRIGDFPRLQIAFSGFLAAVLLPATNKSLDAPEIIFLISLIIAVLYQIYCVLPYLPFYPQQVENSDEIHIGGRNAIKLLICNVWIENKNPQKLVRLIEKTNPDVVVLAEPDERWAKELSALEQNYPYKVSHPLNNTYGMMLFSKLELIEPEIKFLIQDDVPSIHTEVALESGDLIKLYCLHPRPPAPQENDRSTERDAELLVIAELINEHDLPTIVCGDLNDVAWSRTTRLFQKISGLLDPRIGRGLYSSFHARYPLIKFPLDHIFHSNHFRLIELKRLPHIGSDHFPIFASLSYEPLAAMTQEQPVAEREDHIEAVETIQEAFE